MIFAAEISPSLVDITLPRISSTRVFRRRSVIRLANTCGRAATPLAGTPERPEINVAITSRPTTALTREGSAKNTPWRNGFNTFLYRSSVPVRSRCSSTLSFGCAFESKYLKKFALDLSDPEAPESAENGEFRGSPRIV